MFKCSTGVFLPSQTPQLSLVQSASIVKNIYAQKCACHSVVESYVQSPTSVAFQAIFSQAEKQPSFVYHNWGKSFTHDCGSGAGLNHDPALP